ncbi:MAG: SWIM zinc finger family protein [Micromonosporaceae bacterium]|nr:SWIM zinc finger family protein [Micromonosporaceae bacterium]
MAWDGPFPPRSKPRSVEGGIKARSSRGAIGESWWSRRFIQVLESFAIGTRLARGRTYARKGQVISLEVAPGAVTASVQGSRARPYQVRIGLAPFPAQTWAKVEARLAEQALYSAQLLAGEMPPEIEQVFAEAGAPLFPSAIRELAMSCSCPDSAVPCKHLAATFYLLAEAFDADPFRILHWRGRAREDLLARLRELRTGATGSGRGSSAHADVDSPAPIGASVALADLASPPLVETIDRFWLPPVPLPARSATLDTEPDLLLRQLPPPGPTLGGPELVDRLRRAYQAFRG